MKKAWLERFEDCPVIAAIKDDTGLEAALKSDIGIVFVLYGDVCSISKITQRLKEAGKMVIVHLDLIQGLSAKEISVNFIHQTTEADGIISTKPALIRQAKECGMCTVMRFFAIDSMAFDNIRRQSDAVHPDIIEVLPGLMPKVIHRICQESRIPVIAGGLITDKEDIMEVLPGLMPKVIHRICQESRIPVIAGGLITDKEDIMGALNAGAISISTTNQKVWFM